jgi:hypothetical protein
MMKRSFIAFLVVSVIFLSSGTAQAGVEYEDPAGGWTYIYNGNEVSPEVSAALDGTWDHKEGSGGSDAWDGSAIGEIDFDNPDGASPGGVSSLPLDSSLGSYLRIQDAGRPDKGDKGDEGWDWNDPSNRKYTFAHDLGLDSVDGSTILDDGVTLSFRARIPTAGPLDMEYRKDGTTHDWTPAGYAIHSDGLGQFGIKQGTEGDGMVSFCLALESDADEFTEPGLNMNSLSKDSPTGDVEPNKGTMNMLTGFDPTEWHEFWITILQTEGDTGTHDVKIWMDGNIGTPDGEFLVSAGKKDEYDFNGYLLMSMGTSDARGSVDVDFFAYAPGLIAPIPEPATIALLGLGGMFLIRRKRR